MDSEMEALKLEASKYGQEHLFHFWSQLTDDQKVNLLRDVKELNMEKVMQFYEACLQKTGKVDEYLEPLDPEVCGSVAECNADKLASLDDIGFRAVSEGKVAALLMAGGQGTRLGVSYPKGMYQVGLPSNKTLYQIQAERIRRVEDIARNKFGGTGVIPWYIMTSEHTQEATETFFKNHNYFGLKSNNILFFEQYTLPAIDFNGKIVLEKPFKVSKSPDGNGGLYRALRDKGIIADMASRGIGYIHAYCVDNILVRVPDPRFIGFCITKGAECGAKVVEKRQPHEAVGVVGVVKGKYQVVEYSEISEETASKRVPDDGRLVYRSGNVANHFFTLDFLLRVSAADHEEQLVHHVARKKVTFVDISTGQQVVPSSPNAIKMEKFVFDVFQFVNVLGVWEVPREQEFSPLKNAPGSSQDCPETCRASLLAYHALLLRSAGATFPPSTSNGDDNGDSHQAIVEISPLVSFDGEGLDVHAKGLVVDAKEVILERNDGLVTISKS